MSAKRPGQTAFTFTPKQRASTCRWKYRQQLPHGQLVSWPFFAYDAADREDPSTLPGKVKRVADECRRHLPAIVRRPWLNDWLIYNADYDASMTIHHPDGVLCRGTGVQKATLWPINLLHEVGISHLYHRLAAAKPTRGTW